MSAALQGGGQGSWGLTLCAALGFCRFSPSSPQCLRLTLLVYLLAISCSTAAGTAKICDVGFSRVKQNGMLQPDNLQIGTFAWCERRPRRSAAPRRRGAATGILPVPRLQRPVPSRAAGMRCKA